MRPDQHQRLLVKLCQIDERLVNIWIQDDLDLSDDEIWDIFVVLLESRVELLKTCREAGIRLSRDVYLPEWLEKLVSHKREVRLRELKLVAKEIQRRKKVMRYHSVGSGEVEKSLDESI